MPAQREDAASLKVNTMASRALLGLTLASVAAFANGGWLQSFLREVLNSRTSADYL